MQLFRSVTKSYLLVNIGIYDKFEIFLVAIKQFSSVKWKF